MSASLQSHCICGSSPVRTRRPTVSVRLGSLKCEARCHPRQQRDAPEQKQAINPVPGLLAAAVISLAPAAAIAVSGGGGLGGSLAYQDLTGKDFKQVKLYKADLRGTNFTNCDLTGANLFGAFAKDSSFNGANLKFSVLESVDFENADLQNAILEGAEITRAQFKNTHIENSDWTDVFVRKDQLSILCKEAKGKNPKTGVDTRQSLAC